MIKKEYTNSELNEKYIKAVLDNGLKIFVAEKKDYNSAYAVYGTKYGSVDVAFSCDGGDVHKVPAGIAHFLEHKLFESEDGDAFKKYAETGAYANAYTSFDKTCYLFSCTNRFEDNFKILLDFVQHPYFTQATVEKEQGIIGQEIRMYDDSPDWCVLFDMLSSMYHNNPVKVDIAGTVESIRQINADLLYDCYNTFYNPSNMFICVAGNVDADRIIEMAQQSVSGKKSVKISRYFDDEPQTVVRKYTEKKLQVSMPQFCFGFKQNGGNPSVKDNLAINFLMRIAVGSASDLYRTLTEKGLINDKFNFEYFSGDNYAVPMFSGESADPKEVAKAIINEFNRLKSEGIDESLLEAVRREAYGDTVKGYDSIENIVSSFIDAAMNDYGVFDEIDIIKNITSKDLQEYLNIFDEEKSVLSVILPRE